MSFPYPCLLGIWLLLFFLHTYSSEKKCLTVQIPSVDTFVCHILLPSQFVLYMTHPSNTPVLQSIAVQFYCFSFLPFSPSVSVFLCLLFLSVFYLSFLFLLFLGCFVYWCESELGVHFFWKASQPFLIAVAQWIVPPRMPRRDSNRDLPFTEGRRANNELRHTSCKSFAMYYLSFLLTF